MCCIMTPEVAKKCRTCMGECTEAYHQLFDYVDENYKILEMLDDIVPQIQIKTVEGSCFSHLVCQLCVDKLLTGYKFQKQCIETDKQLHEMLKDEVEVKALQMTNELEKIFDPLTSVESVKMKQEPDESVKYECEINPEDIVGNTLKSDDACESRSENDRLGNYNDMDGSDTDSSNEKLSVLKERKLRMSKNDRKTKHSKDSDRKSQYPCSECGKVFDRLIRLKRHITVHDKKKAFLCEVCDYSFTTEKSYLAHTRLHDQESNDVDSVSATFTCTHCPKTFNKKSALVLHTQVHAKTKTNAIKKKRKKKDIKNKEGSEKIEDIRLSLLQIEDGSNEEINQNTQPIEDTQSQVVIKVENMEQLFKESTVDFEDTAEWLNNDRDSDSSEFEDEQHNGSLKTDLSKNIDFVDTGIGEIEKPNTRNRRNGNYPCDVCGKIFDRPYRLKRHSSVHSLERPHACEFCKYRFATANLLKIHLVQHESETGGNLDSQSRPDGFKCPDCPRRFEKQASLSAHRQVHTRNALEANYPCTVCKRNFMSVRSLTEHITNKHPDVEKHKCDQCDKSFVLHAHLVEHLNRHKGNKNLVCLICEKEFGYTNTLKEHMRTHSGESPFLCPQCGKTFRSSSNLRQHMERHFGLKKYQCPECPSRFNCRSDLIKHMSTHTNAKPHVCDVCGSRFTRSYSLQKHKLLHSGERPFKCDQCNMTFAIIYHLRRHMRTHTGEKPYKCKYCDRAYAESGDLTKHLRTHVGENTYICDQCPMAFKYHSELRKHVSEHYKMAQQLLTNVQKISGEEDHNDSHPSMHLENANPPVMETSAPVVMNAIGGC